MNTALHKRRVIYMSDAEWEATTAEAKRNQVSASELIRDCLRRGHLRGYQVQSGTQDQVAHGGIAMAQAERDAILRRVNRKGSGA